MPHRVLILKPCCLGDVLLTTPLAASLAAAWPSATLDWAVDTHSRPALANNPDVADRLDATGCVRGAWRPGGVVRLVLAMRAGHYDAVFVPDRSPVLALAARAAGIPLRVGLDSGGRGRWYTVRVPVPPVRHEAELYLDLARAIGLRPMPPQLVFNPTRQDQLVARRTLSRLLEIPPPPLTGPVAMNGATHGPDHVGPLVAVHLGGGVNPGQKLLEKRWPAERWVTLLDRLYAERGARLVLLGGPGDRPTVDAVRKRLAAPALDASGTLTLGETAAVIQTADLYLGHDTGVSHLATAVGTPSVVLFGPTDPARYGPLPGTGIAVAPASGAVQRLEDATGSAAILDVTVDGVWSAVTHVLDGAQAMAGR